MITMGNFISCCLKQGPALKALLEALKGKRAQKRFVRKSYED